MESVLTPYHVLQCALTFPNAIIFPFLLFKYASLFYEHLFIDGFPFQNNSLFPWACFRHSQDGEILLYFKDEL